jgi:lipoprotein-releasing system ATP-binding protein
MDEPTGNLDPDTAAQVLSAMATLRASATAFIVVTHDRTIANQMDRQLVLKAGQLEQP